MLKFIICAMVSFSLGLFISWIIEYFKRKKKHKRRLRCKKVKPLNQQDFKKAMEDLKIK